jgi:hypothetical protein
VLLTLFVFNANEPRLPEFEIGKLSPFVDMSEDCTIGVPSFNFDLNANESPVVNPTAIKDAAITKADIDKRDMFITFSIK